MLRGTLTLGTADFSKKVLLAATVLLCAHFLLPETFGDYLFLLSFYQIFAVLGGAGIPNSLLRRVARHRRTGIRDSVASVLARLVYIAPASVLMYAAMRLMGFSARYMSALGLLALIMVVRGAVENIMSIFQGAEDQISSAKVGVSQSAVTLLATLAVCLTSKNLLLLISAHALGGFVGTACGFALLLSRRSSGQAPSPTILGESRDLLKESHWLNAGAFVASIYNRVDVVLLRRFLTSEAVAIYGAPYRVLDLTQIVPSSLMATILPSLCRKDAPTSGGISHPRTAMRFLLMIALCVIVIVTVTAPWITLLLFGAKYQASIPVLQVLIWATVPMYWNFVLVSQLIANSFDRAILKAATIAMVVNVGLNLLLIPRFGYLACAGVTLVTEFAFLAVNLHSISKVGAAAIPEHFGRLVLTTILIAGFCLCRTVGRSSYATLAGILLLTASLSIPVFRADFLTSGQIVPPKIEKTVVELNG